MRFPFRRKMHAAYTASDCPKTMKSIRSFSWKKARPRKPKSTDVPWPSTACASHRAGPRERRFESNWHEAIPADSRQNGEADLNTAPPPLTGGGAEIIVKKGAPPPCISICQVLRCHSKSELLIEERAESPFFCRNEGQEIYEPQRV